MIAEATSEIVDSSFAVARHIWYLSDVIEHVSAGEQEHSDQAESGPQIAVLDDRHDVWCSNGEEGDESEEGCRNCDDLYIIDGSDDGGLRQVGGELASNPCVDLFGGLRATDNLEIFFE